MSDRKREGILTREIIIEGLGNYLREDDLTRAVCHDAFDSFVLANEKAVYAGTEPLAAAWRWFRLGWESQYNRRAVALKTIGEANPREGGR